MNIKLMDCTLRDGGNVIGKGFPKNITDMVLNALVQAKVPFIEMGNAGGIGAYEVSGFTSAETDEIYLNLASKYCHSDSEIGMFLNAKRFRSTDISLARDAGLSFIRVGADAGDASISLEAIRTIKKEGLQCFYALMKAYILSPKELSEEARILEDNGLDLVTIMDSAGFMLPTQVAEYTSELVKAVSIPVAFHGHNNLELSAANAISAIEHGATVLDCALMGMARSAGNLPTEICISIMHRYGYMQELDLHGLLHFINDELQPAMDIYDFHNPVPPLDLVLGLSGCHSSFLPLFKRIAKETGVSLYELIANVSQTEKKTPTEKMIVQVAERLKNQTA